MNRSSIIAIALGFGTGLASASCLVRPLTDHCANADGDAYCLEKYPEGERRFCNLGTCDLVNLDGCGDDRMDDACYSPCGGDKSLADDPECEGLADTSSESGSSTVTTSASTEPTGDPTTEPTSTTQGTSSMTSSDTETSSTTEAGCTDDDECNDPLLPFCIATVCVPCTDAAAGADDRCEEKDALLPVCGDDGACVQCTPENPSACTDTTPVCDGPSSACVACTYHEQCPDSACRIATGACFETYAVYDVGQGQTYETIDEAATALGQGMQVVLRLHSGASFDEDLTLSGMDTAYAFISTDDPPPQWVRTIGMGPTLTVDNSAEAYVQNVRLTGNLFGGAAAIEADDARVYLDRAEVVANTGGGISLTNGAYASVRNCFVGGSNSTDIAALNVTSSSADILYTTLVGYDDGFGDGTALRCAGATTLVVRNSLLVKTGTGPELECGDADVTYSATEGNTPGTGNAMLGSVMADWFVNTTSDYHLNNPPAALADVARWVVGDPTVDIDGMPRVNVDGSMEAAGADLP